MAELINKPNTKSLSKPINQKMQKLEAQIHKIIMKEKSWYLEEIKRLTRDYAVQLCKSNWRPSEKKEYF